MNFAEYYDDLRGDTEIVTEKLEGWADGTPERPFIYYGEDDRTFSYGEFNRLANRLAHGLRELGIERGDRVSLFLFNPFVTTVAMFAIWKVGAWYCPINFNYQGRLLSYQINDTAPKALISEASLLPRLAEVAEDIGPIPLIVRQPEPDEHDYGGEFGWSDSRFPVHRFDELLSDHDVNLGVRIEVSDPANIVYTSGTTGPAKGVVQPYRYMNCFTYGYRKISTSEDVIYNDLPLYHVGGAFFNLNRAVWLGGKVGLWDKFSPGDFWARIRKCGATTAVFLDVMIPWLMNAPARPDDRENTINKVHMQPLPNYHREVAARFGIDIVTAGFGQTESGNSLIAVTEGLPDGEGTPAELYRGLSRSELREQCERYQFPFIRFDEDVSERYMGRATPFHEVSVRTDLDEECPRGELGHLCLRPKIPHMMLTEYFNKLEATRDVFANQWFHTGDGAVHHEDGSFTFVDRIGGFIRVRGENISSYQVEDIMNAHPAIRATAAFPIPSVDGDEDDLVACVERQSGETLEEAELRQWLQGQMPKFMWPRHIRFMEDFPRTPTNKVEKYKLKQTIMDELGVTARI